MDTTWVPENAGLWMSGIIVFLIVYYFLLAASILQMLSAKPNQVLLVFAFLALIPVPPAIVMGIVIMIIWAIHGQSS